MGKAVLYLVGYAVTAWLLWAYLTQQVRPIDAQMEWIRWAFLIAFTPALLRYLIQLVVAPFYEAVMARRRRKLRESGHVAEQPLVSILVPAWNEEVGIAATVRSILRSDYPHIETIVIDDGSTDNTAAVMAALVAEQDATGSEHRLICRSVPNGGKSRALNTGLRMSKGEIIITIDADSVIEPDAVRAFVAAYEDPKVMCVAGNVKVGNYGNAVGFVQHFEYLFSFFFKKADSLLNAVYIVGGAAASYRRRVFKELGGFDDTIITEDIEISTRIQNAGWTVQYAPDAVIWTEGAPTFLGLSKQRVRWKYGRLVTFWRYRNLFFSLDRRHSKMLSLLVLPVALLSDFLLLVQPVVLTLLIFYTIAGDDYLPLLAYAALIMAMVVIQVLSDVRRRRHLHLLPFSPAAWVMIYIIDVIELQALVRSFWRLGTGAGLQWQRWTREGVFEQEDAPVTRDPAVGQLPAATEPAPAPSEPQAARSVEPAVVEPTVTVPAGPLPRRALPGAH